MLAHSVLYHAQTSATCGRGQTCLLQRCALQQHRRRTRTDARGSSSSSSGGAAAATCACALDDSSNGLEQAHNPRALQPADLQQQLEQLHRQAAAGVAAPTQQPRDAAAAALAAELRGASSVQQLVELVVGVAGVPPAAATAKAARQHQQQQQRQQQQLQQQLQAGVVQLNAIHLAALVAALVRLQPPTPAAAAAPPFAPLVAAAFARVQQQLPALAPRQLANMLWAAAKLQQPPPAQALRAMLGRMATGDGMLAAANSQDVSMCLYAAAQLGLQVPEQQLEQLLGAAARELHGAAPQAVANTLWALAALQHRPAQQWLQRVEEHCTRVLQRQSLADASGGDHSSAASSSSNSNSSSSSSSSSASSSTPGGFSGHGLYLLLWAAARLHWAPGAAFLDAFWRASARQLPRMSPHGVSGLLWAAASLQLAPPAAWMAAWHMDALQQLAAGRWAPQDHANALWALARMGQRPDAAWLDAAVRASAAALPSAGAQELSNVLWALARLRVRPGAPWMAAWLASMQRRMRSYCAPALACSAYSLGLLRYRPPRGWCETLLGEAQRQMGAFGAQELSNLIWALAVLQLKPSRQWLRDFQLQALSEAGSFNAQELSLVCWALARLQHVPPPGWVAALLREGLEPPGGGSGQSSALLVWALTRWRLPELRENGRFRALLPRYWAVAQQLLPTCSLAQLSMLWWGRVKLGCLPAQQWRGRFWAAATPALRAAGGSDASAVVRLLLGTGRLRAVPPPAALLALLQAAERAVPCCASLGSLSAMGLGLTLLHRMQRGPPLASAAAAARMQHTAVQQAAGLWGAWFERSTLLLQQSQQQQSPQQHQQHQHQQQQAVRARDLGLQLNCVSQLRLAAPHSWRAAAAASLPGTLAGASAEQLGWLLCGAAKLRLADGEACPAWPGLAVARCVALQAARARCSDACVRRLSRAFRRLRRRAQLGDTEWAAWACVEAAWGGGGGCGDAGATADDDVCTVVQSP